MTNGAVEQRVPPSALRHSPQVSSCSLFSRPLTLGHGNCGRNVRSDWQDKECRPSLLHKRIWDTLRGEQWRIWARLDHWWADDCQKSTSSLHKPDYLCVAEEQRGNRCRRKGQPVGISPLAESLEKGIDLHTRARLRGLDLSHPLGAFNKSIQATGSPHTCGHNRRRMAKEWWGGAARGDDTWRRSLFNPWTSHQDDRGAERKETRGYI